MSIKILGGHSQCREISISSVEFVSTAKCDENGKITCQVKSYPPVIAFLRRHRRWPIPGLIRLMIVIGSQFNGKQRWLYFTTPISMLIIAWTQRFLFPANLKISQVVSPWQLWVDSLILVVILIALLGRKKESFTTWHGAEHMVIGAYDRYGSTELEIIAKQDRFHPKCGGRLLLPFVIVFVVGLSLSTRAQANLFFGTLLFWEVVLVELVLLVDRLIGWDKIPITAQASWLLQRYVTTRQPGELELRTAQTALIELLRTPHKYLG